jgi:hypothetical protein
VSNIGTTDFDITTAEVFVNANEPVSILDSFSTTALAPNETTFGTVEQNINICGSDNFTVTFDVIGTTNDGFECSDTDVFQFIPPPITPTPPPPILPTLAPTPDPETSACALDAGIVCNVTQGSVVSCDDLTVPRTQCLSAPTRLDFTFTGASCVESNNNATNFQCMDVQSIVDSSSVFIVMEQMEETLFEGVVGLGQSVSITGEFENDITVTITSVNENGEAGDETLQVMTIGTACTEEDDLTLLNTFGSLQLVAYDNADGLESVFASLLISYVVDNISIDASVTSAVATSSISGSQDFAPFDINYQETEVFPGEEVFVNLAEASDLSFEFNVEGVGAISGIGCDSTASLILSFGL